MTEVDGAQDKLFHEDSANSLKDHVEVKFVSPDSAKNGDAKINIGDLKSFAGMGEWFGINNIAKAKLLKSVIL